MGPCMSVKSEEFASNERDCEQSDFLVSAGGYSPDQSLSKLVTTLPSSPQTSNCIPELPVALRWGALGLLGSTLYLCGGEDVTQQPQSYCWSLSNRNSEVAEWRRHINITNARSQLSSSVVDNGSAFLLFGGYNFDEEHKTLATSQLVIPATTEEEEQTPTEFRLSAAVTLETGDVLVSGGKGRESQLWMWSPSSSQRWQRKRNMTEGRKGHAAAAINTSDIIVAGGWNERGHELSSVYLYSLVEDEWREMPSMPKSRVDFVLKVSQVLILQNHDMCISLF